MLSGLWLHHAAAPCVSMGLSVPAVSAPSPAASLTTTPVLVPSLPLFHAFISLPSFPFFLSSCLFFSFSRSLHPLLLQSPISPQCSPAVILLSLLPPLSPSLALSLYLDLTTPPPITTTAPTTPYCPPQGLQSWHGPTFWHLKALQATTPVHHRTEQQLWRGGWEPQQQEQQSSQFPSQSVSEEADKGNLLALRVNLSLGQTFSQSVRQPVGHFDQLIS